MNESEAHIMTNDNAISVRDVTKKYRLFASPKERLKEALHPFRKRYHQEFWALNGVSFDVPRGHTIGIIGRNGSGKSTLLQIIASVLQPTSGSIVVRGRVAALLELGAGFNPDFTGRDNAILYGVIQGISRNEMLQRISEIEAFADIGEFFNQPVRIYSSGMFLRVAFATAINVDPDILIVDEVLSIGDIKFQEKCFRKFESLKQSNTSILLVSHDLNIFPSLCDRALILEEGNIFFEGSPTNAVNKYQSLIFNPTHVRKKEIHRVLFEESPKLDNNDHETSFHETRTVPALNAGVEYDEINYVNEIFRTFFYDQSGNDKFPLHMTYNRNEERFGTGKAVLLDYFFVVDSRIDPPVFRTGARVILYIKGLANKDMRNVCCGYAIYTVDGIKIYSDSNKFSKGYVELIPAKQEFFFKFVFENKLNSGHYFISIGVEEMLEKELSIVDVRKSVIQFEVSSKHHLDGICDLKEAPINYYSGSLIDEIDYMSEDFWQELE